MPSRTLLSRIAPFLVAFLFVLPGPQAAAAPPVKDSSTDANIVRLTTNILEQSQFGHHAFDSSLVGKFLDNYLDSLDGNRMLFLKSDADEFGKFKDTLVKATRDAGDTGAAQMIYKRYLERLDQRAQFITKTLKSEKFDFSGRDVYSRDRDEAERPADLAAAQTLWKQQLRADYLQEKLGDTKPAEINTKLTRRVTTQLATMKSLRNDEVLEIYLNSLAHLYDPHSDYLGREQMESFSISMNLSLFGIGAVLESRDGFCTIRELVNGGPAARSGVLKPGDKIVTVAQASKDAVDVLNMPLTRIVQQIRGPKGTTVTLGIIPAGAPEGSPAKTISLVRDEIHLEDQQAKARIYDMPAANGGTLRLGMIDIPEFYAEIGDRKKAEKRSVTADVVRLVTKLKAEKVQGIALDLRRNGGGSLGEAISLTGLFIKKGPVVQTRGARGDVDVEQDPDPSVLYDGPLVVLTSRFSASASEILAGAMQDYGRAVIIGDSQTFGKGTVQTILPLNEIMDQNGIKYSYNPGAVKVTIRKFYRPGGASTQLRGVSADIVLPSVSDFDAVSESSLKNPLPWDSVPASSFTPTNRVASYLTSLRDRSTKRVAGDKAFTDLKDEIVRVKGALDSKTISLNEAERREEQAKSKARRTAREQENAKLRKALPKSYAITLANASNPGLPAPTAAEPEKKETAKGSSDAQDDSSTSGMADDLILSEGMNVLADYVDASRGVKLAAAAPK